ncbi:MAG: ankyrin repeat domain-containing protein [Verrucomicrobium sp.]|nr:ankyrin repeat domain-containing protein [Verrucomicrobium sp.]
MRLFPFKTPLPLNEETRQRLHGAIAEHRLQEFSQRHRLSLDHFLLRDSNGSTAFHLAVGKGAIGEVASILKTTGTPFSLEHCLLKDRSGRTLFHQAAQSGHLDRLAAILKESGQSLSLDHLLVTDRDKRTALHRAAWGGHLEQIAAVLRESGQVLLPEHFLLNTYNHRTPLLLAGNNGHLEQVFSPALWLGRFPEMRRLWEHVPEKHRPQVDFDRAAHETLLLSRHPLPRLGPQAFGAARRPSPSFPETRGQNPGLFQGNPPAK